LCASLTWRIMQFGESGGNHEYHQYPTSTSLLRSTYEDDDNDDGIFPPPMAQGGTVSPRIIDAGMWKGRPKGQEGL
jgi:hypothetical protein